MVFPFFYIITVAGAGTHIFVDAHPLFLFFVYNHTIPPTII